jgi:hypothetical protein
VTGMNGSLLIQDFEIILVVEKGRFPIDGLLNYSTNAPSPEGGLYICSDYFNQTGLAFCCLFIDSSCLEGTHYCSKR